MEVRQRAAGESKQCHDELQDSTEWYDFGKYTIMTDSVTKPQSVARSQLKTPLHNDLIFKTQMVHGLVFMWCFLLLLTWSQAHLYLHSSLGLSHTDDDDTSGEVCPKTFRHVHWRSWGSNHRPTLSPEPHPPTNTAVTQCELTGWYWCGTSLHSPSMWQMSKLCRSLAESSWNSLAGEILCE